MYTIVRTTSENEHFRALVNELDKDLAIRDGDDHAFYAQFNKIDSLQHVVVLYEGTEAIGCGAIKEYDTGTAEVKRMFVAPTYRNKGYASAILKELENMARQLGYTKCILETGVKQPEAISLYRKNAYAIMPNYGQYEGVTDSICFCKTL